MAALLETRTQTKAWSMWVGSSSDLQRLFRVVQKQYDSLIAPHVEEKLEQPRRMLEWAEARRVRLRQEATEDGIDSSLASRISENDAEIKKLNDDIKEAEEAALDAGSIELSLTAMNGDRTTLRGTASQLMEYISGERFKYFVALAPSGDIRGRSITIGVDRGTGIDLRVSSTDAQWCRAAFAELEDEISKHVPRWKFIRRQRVLWAFFATLISCVWLLALSRMPSGLTLASQDALWWIAGLTLVSATIMVLALNWTRAYLPAFELVPPNGRARGIALIRWFGTVAATLVLGIIGSALTDIVLG